jgi:type IV secretion system protein VirB10
MKLIPLILLLLLMMGCEDEPQSIKKPLQALNKDLYKVPEIPKEPKEHLMNEPLAATPVEFPAVSPLLREDYARTLRGRRQAAFTKEITKSKAAKLNYDFKDKDYQRWESLPENKSSFPVERSRMITNDMRIGAVLEDNINSQIPGRVILIVDRDILSPNGKYILLPAYTKIICAYEALSHTGETRLPLSCSRILRPDGLSIVLTNATCSDQMGRSGLIGTVDNRVFERYGAAFIVSGISALAQSGVNQRQAPWMNQSANALSNNLGQVTSEVLQQTIDLRPIISIKAGSRVQLIPKVDIVLREPEEKP